MKSTKGDQRECNDDAFNQMAVAPFPLPSSSQSSIEDHSTSASGEEDANLDFLMKGSTDELYTKLNVSNKAEKEMMENQQVLSEQPENFRNQLKQSKSSVVIPINLHEISLTPASSFSPETEFRRQNAAAAKFMSSCEWNYQLVAVKSSTKMARDSGGLVYENVM
uniref:Uncharacterized protein n=1 Tax=Sphaerodactylus townsendi TaxID=933632 RepID=A0ACB8F3Z2_9SAUR